MHTPTAKANQMAPGMKSGYKEMWPTAMARDCKGGFRTESLTRKDGKSRATEKLPNAVLDGKGTETVTGQLNAEWVTWLMGYPPGYLILDPSGT